MKEIKSLRENEAITVEKNEDLEIHCDVPNGVSINMKDANLMIRGNVGENVTIHIHQTPLADLKDNNGNFLIVLRDGTRLTRSRGNESFNPMIFRPLFLKGNITITGDISDTAEIMTFRGGIVTVKEQKMLVTDPDSRFRVFEHDLLRSLIKTPCKNIPLFRQRMDTIVQSELGVLICGASRFGQAEYLNLLLEYGRQKNIQVNFDAYSISCRLDTLLARTTINMGETALTLALQHSHISCAKTLIMAGCPIRSQNSMAKPIMDFAKQGHCEQEFQDLLTTLHYQIPIETMDRDFERVVCLDETPENIDKLERQIESDLQRPSDIEIIEAKSSIIITQAVKVKTKAPLPLTVERLRARLNVLREEYEQSAIIIMPAPISQEAMVSIIPDAATSDATSPTIIPSASDGFSTSSLSLSTDSSIIITSAQTTQPKKTENSSSIPFMPNAKLETKDGTKKPSAKPESKAVASPTTKLELNAAKRHFAKPSVAKIPKKPIAKKPAWR